jgi:hypothetical protein
VRIPDAVDVDLGGVEARRIVRRTWGLLRPHRRGLAVIAVLVVAQAGGMVAGPALVRYGIDEGVRAADVSALERAALMFLAAATVAYLSGRLAIRAVARVGEAFLRDLRERVFAHQLSSSMGFFDRHRTGTLVSRMTSDIEALQELIGQGLTMFVVNSLLLSGAVVVMVAMSWQLALGTLVVVPMLAKATSWFRRESNEAYLHLRESIGTNLSTIQEGLAGVRVVQAFNQEGPVVERFDGTNEQLLGAHMRTERIAARYFPVVELAQGISIAVILGLGGYLSSRDVVTVGTVAAFVLYLQNLFEPVQQLSQLFNQLQASAASLHKLYGLLDESLRGVRAPGRGGPSLPRRARRQQRLVRVRAWRAGARRRLAHGRGGRAAGTRGAHRCGQVDAGQADVPDLRPRHRDGLVRWHRPPGCHAALPPSPDRGGSPGGLPVLRDGPGQPPHRSAWCDGRRDRCRDRPARAGRAVPLLRRRPRDRGPGTGGEPLGGGAPAGLPCAGSAGRSRGDRARRGHVQPGSRHGADRRARPRAPDGGPHRRGRRPPPLHRRPCRSHRCGGRGSLGGGREPHRAAGPGRRLRGSVRLVVGRARVPSVG